MSADRTDHIDAHEITDAVGERASSTRGSLEYEAFDLSGGLSLRTPTTGRRLDAEFENPLGGLVYRTARGCTAVEAWPDEAA